MILYRLEMYVLSLQMKVICFFLLYFPYNLCIISWKILNLITILIFEYILKLFSRTSCNFLKYKEHLPFNVLPGYNNLCDSCLPINRHSIPPLPFFLSFYRLPSKCKFFFFGIKVSVVMTLNKIGSDFKKLNFYWLFAKSEITFFLLSISRPLSLSVSLACWHVLHLAHAICYSKFPPLIPLECSSSS